VCAGKPVHYEQTVRQTGRPPCREFSEQERRGLVAQVDFESKA
jgi:hypothetical protein